MNAYSVTTWKVGATWDVNEQLRFRFTQSRDIRAGNLGELFTPTAVALANVVNPNTSVAVPVQTVTSGNPTLAPEEADTFTAGVVFSPAAIEGLQFSIDYYSIDIDGVIGTLTPQQITDQCYREGVQEFCQRITLDSNDVIVGIDNSFANLDRFETSGVDFVASYSRPIGEGDVSMRLMSTYVDRRRTTYLADESVEDSVGVIGNPEWKHFVVLNYRLGNFSAGLDWRWYGKSVIDIFRTEGCSGLQCANINNLSSMHFSSLNVGYDLPKYGANLFLRIDNLFDKAPPFPLRNAYNDNFGRGFRTGVRFAF